MSFDRLAPFYRAMEWLLAGGKLQRCRVAWLAEIPEPRRILLVGEGHGRFLEVCARRFPQAAIMCVDASRGMLRVSEARWRAAGGRPGAIEFVQALLPEWPGDAGSFDLIVTNFFLDCFTAAQLGPVVAALARRAAPDACWLIADFNVPPRGWQRWRARLILASAYAFFHWATALPARELIPPDGFLSAAGFRLTRRRLAEWGLLHADVWVRSA